MSSSGLEVWLYDDGNCEMIRDSGVMDFFGKGFGEKFHELARQGIFVGYSLHTDDDLDIAVYVGDPLSEAEMSVARWLEPQRAFLRLPSGRLCVESNDASRIGPGEPGAKGGLVALPAGDYRMSLYRIDHEALDREGLTWEGAQEVIVLTPGGNPSDAADDLLPYQLRRDTNWIGDYRIQGKRAEALAWFDSYWDTFVLNLDSAAASKLALAPGSYIRAHVPTVGITVTLAFAQSGEDAQRMPEPSGDELEEYGYAVFCHFDDWDRAEALLCRRERTKTRVEDKHLNVWIPAFVEVLDEQPTRVERAFAGTQLGTKNYYDPGFLSLVLSEVIPEAGDLDELPLPRALDMVDRKLRKIGLAPQGDMSWEEKFRGRRQEVTGRFYTGLPNAFAAILASAGCFELLFLSQFEDGTWIVTGFTDEIEARLLPARNPGVQLQSIDDHLPKIFTAHKASLQEPKKGPVPAPDNLEEAAAAFRRFLTAAFD